MYEKKHSMASLVYALCIFVFFFINGDCWGKDYSPNVHWVFCIDTSGSMKTKGNKDLLKAITGKITNEFINTKNNMIKTGDRITIISFDKKVRLEATALFQTEDDLNAIKEKLKSINNRRGSLTFISEAIVRGIDVINKYGQFFHTNALYVFTDGKSEPYSFKWSKKRIEKTKKRDLENFNKISLAGKNNKMNIWVGVLKWEAFSDAESLVEKIGPGGHLVDLTDFSRLSLAKALGNFAHSVRSKVKLSDMEEIDLGTIPYKGITAYNKKISLDMQTDKDTKAPSIIGRINFDPDNPSEIRTKYPLKIKTTEDKMVLNFEIPESSELKPGIYKGKLNLLPSEEHLGAMIIEPSEFLVEFKKSGYLSFYLWKAMLLSVVSLLFLFYSINKIKKKMPIKL